MKWVCVGRGRGGLGRSGGRRSEFIAGEGIAAFLHCSRGTGTHDVGLQLYWAGENEHGREAAEIDRDGKGNERAGEQAREMGS